MKDKIKDIEKLVGNTPMVKINYKFEGKVRYAYFKLEWYSITGSIKDRVAINIIKEGIKSGKLKVGQEIVEVTSGNMGISLTAIGKYLGHKVTIFMPKNMSEERKKLLRLYGANLIEVDNFEKAFSESEKYALKNNAFLAHQFQNKSNFYAHYNKTAMEILSKIRPKYFVAGVGTSGTLSGIGKKLKEEANTKVIAVEPFSSPILSTGIAKGEHKLQGLSDEIVPKLYDKTLVDRIIAIKDEDAIALAQKVNRELGLGIGISGGANFVAVIESGKNDIVSIFPDDNKKYLTTDLVIDVKSNFANKVEFIDYEVL